jgi:hypothetical protein
MRLLAIILAAASVAAVSGCGTAQVGGDEPSGPKGSTELTVVVKTGPGQGKRTFSLVCDPPGGDHPNPSAACRSLEELEAPFAPVPPDQACTEIYGGPQTATVTGTFEGEPVDAEFDRTNGCEIARWDAHVDLLVEAGGAFGS